MKDYKTEKTIGFLNTTTNIENMHEDVLNKNRFILRFPEDCELHEWMVSSVLKSPFYFLENYKNSNTLEIKMKNWTYGDIQLKEIMNKFNKANHKYIIYEDLDKTGVVVTKEYYLEPKISCLSCDECDYTNETLKTYKIIIRYDSVVSDIETIE